MKLEIKTVLNTHSVFVLYLDDKEYGFLDLIRFCPCVPAHKPRADTKDQTIHKS